MKYRENTSLIINIITDSASPSERKQFDRWLNESEKNLEYFQKVKTLWEVYGQPYEKMEFDEMLAMEKIREKIKTRQPGHRIKRMQPWYWAAASIILILGTALWLIKQQNIGENDLLTFKSGESITEIVLSDSTHVWLHKHSELIAPRIFAENKRNVSLEGEAFFEVTKDISRPFKVKAGKTTTEVLGTSFNIFYKKETGKVRVIVSTGKVAFYKTNSFGTKEILLPGHKAKYHADNDYFELSQNFNPNYLSWKTGVISFYETPLVKVCSTLSNHFQKDIITNITDPEVTLTGNFDNESLENILEIIKITLDVEFIQSENEISILK